MSSKPARPSSPTVERRSHPRVPFVTNVRYRFEDVESFKEHQAADLSAGGMFIATEEPEAEGTLIHFEFEASGSRLLAGFGRVVRVNEVGNDEGLDPGMGIEFLKLDDQSRRVLQELLLAER